jgi:hypothetical protein
LLEKVEKQEEEKLENYPKHFNMKKKSISKKKRDRF